MSENEQAPQVEPYEPVEFVHEPVRAELQRSVRFGRILIGGAILGAVIGAIASLFFPVVADGQYEMGQIVGFMVVVGGVIGLALGAILSLLLARAVKNTKGAAMVTQIDVR